MKKQSMKTVCYGLLGVAMTCAAIAADDKAPRDADSKQPEGLRFALHRVGNFRSEACCVADYNGDGKLDILAGDFLYLAPDWKSVKIRSIKGSVDEAGKGYYWDFANLALDVDGDGKPDLISVDWFEKRSVWLRNTGTSGEPWPLEIIEENGNFETAELCDLDGDGKEQEVIPCVARTVWYEVVKGADGKRNFARHIVSETAMPFGVGAGDLNGDGRPDLIRPSAWFEAPTDIRTGKWIEHPLALGHKEEGKSDHTGPILVFDVNGDSLNDIICSSAHEYGIFWYEQLRENSQVKFKQHLIDASWTQAHSLALGDLDGDGMPELVAGKRFMAHNGGDPEETAPLGLYYYKLKRQASPTWTKHVISYNEGVASSMNICLADMDGDGDLDIVVTGKWGGPAWFENKRK